VNKDKTYLLVILQFTSYLVKPIQTSCGMDWLGNRCEIGRCNCLSSSL